MFWVIEIIRKSDKKNIVVSGESNIDTTISSKYGEEDMLFVSKQKRKVRVIVDDFTPSYKAGQRVNGFEKIAIIIVKVLIKFLTRKT